MLGKKVYTLFGYSKLDYEDKRKTMAKVRQELEMIPVAERSQWVVNIGATEDGIGAAYGVAKALGFETIGVVSTKALTYSGKFSPDVDRIYIINDKNWGGYLPGTQQLAPATEVFLQVSQVISAFGGGEITATSLRESVARGIETHFTPAEMNHEKTKSTDYAGPAYRAWQDIKDVACQKNLMIRR